MLDVADVHLTQQERVENRTAVQLVDVASPRQAHDATVDAFMLSPLKRELEAEAEALHAQMWTVEERVKQKRWAVARGC